MTQITPKPTASQRTKNRIREHGPRFSIEDEDAPSSMNGDSSVLCRAPDGWLGWLPVAEINMRD